MKKVIYEPISITKKEMIETYKEFVKQPEHFTKEQICLWKTFIEELELIANNEEFDIWIQSKKSWSENLTI